MTAHYEDGPVQIWHGDCIDVMRQMPDASVDAVVTDPPYGLEFMGREWDRFKPAKAQIRKPSARDVERGIEAADTANSLFKRNQPDAYVAGRPFQAWCEEWAREAYRLLKPGGHLLAFGGTRTFHRLTSGVEDAGFEIRDSIAWLYGSGFPKSLDVSKAIDRLRDERHDEALAVTIPMRAAMYSLGLYRRDLNNACGLGDSDSGSAQSWTTTTADGAHKPRVPTIEQWAILRELLHLESLDAEVWRLNGRKGTPGDAWEQRKILDERRTEVRGGSWAEMAATGRFRPGEKVIRTTAPATADAARWNGWGTALKPAFEPIVVARKPLIGTVAANVLAYGTGALNIDGSRIPGTVPSVPQPNLRGTSGHFGSSAGRIDEMSSAPAGRWPANVVLDASQAAALDQQSGDRRSAGDYPSGASTAGLFGQRQQGQLYADAGGASRFFYTAKASTDERPSVDGIAHPTVKPVDLMRWLVRLVTPPGGVVLEPFAGSGTTVEACVLEGFHCIAIEREADYLPLILQRIRKPHAVGLDFGEWEA